ncbi:hypothetical protein ABSA28_00019 [Candidatus Hepatincolaceae symbiont of Richtersius coronifer]
MKKITFALVFLIIFTVNILSKEVLAKEGFYISLGLGGITAKNRNVERSKLIILSSSLPSTSYATSKDYKPDGLGASYSLALGYNFGRFALELAGGQSKNEFKEVTRATNYYDSSINFPDSLALSTTNFMLNGYFKIFHRAIINPYFGAGVGMSIIKDNVPDKSIDYFYKGVAASSAVTGALRAGIQVPLDPSGRIDFISNVTLALEYSFLFNLALNQNVHQWSDYQYIPQNNNLKINFNNILNSTTNHAIIFKLNYNF